MSGVAGPGGRPLADIHVMMVQELEAREARLKKGAEQADELARKARGELHEVRKDLRAARKRAAALGANLRELPAGAPAPVSPRTSQADVCQTAPAPAAPLITDEAVIAVLRAAGEPLTRDQLGDRLGQRRGLHMKLARLTQRGDVVIVETGDQVAYAAAAAPIGDIP